MRIGIPLRRSRADRVGTMEPLEDALGRVLDTARPVEPIEVSLTEAVGMVLAEPVVADVDLPPFDRAAARGYAVRAAEAIPGALLRVAQSWSDDGHEVEPGEAARVELGEAMPVGADAVLSPESVRPDPATGKGRPRVIEVVDTVEPGHGVVRRGATLAAGSILAEAGVRITPAMVALLAAQGCVHPLCHRRVRVAILAVGDHLVGPADAPVLHHERNATGLAVGALILGAGGMVHDLGAMCESEFVPALHRALNAHLVVIVGRLGAEGRRALARAGVEANVAGVALEPGGAEVAHGLSRDADGQTVTHVFQVALEPVAAVVTTTLCVLPLLARLQGGTEPALPTGRAVWEGPPAPHADRLQVIPARLLASNEGRLIARPVTTGPSDIPTLALADGLALLPPSASPSPDGQVITFAPFTGWPGLARD